MTSVPSAPSRGLFTEDAWAWWQARRLRYNLVLGLAGWLAYGLTVALNYGFGHPVWANWRGALGVTLMLGLGFLVVMGAANICFLAGPALEAWLKPADPARFRAAAWRMGLWGSAAVPFLFPLFNLAIFIGGGRTA